METTELKPILEALIFASEEPISLAALSVLVEELGGGRGEVKEVLQELAQDYNENNLKGLLLREVAGGYQFVTKPVLAAWIQKLNVAKPKSLSQASLETLAIIAYRQPLVRSEMEAIRGVDSGGVLKTLLERGLIKILGRREEAGQPLIYGTTPAFLELFHLNSLEELPSMKEIEQLVENQQAESTQAAKDGGISEVEWSEDSNLEARGADSIDFLGENLGEEDGALADLEESMKELKRIEKEMFPKEAAAEEPPTAAAVPADAPSEPEL